MIFQALYNFISQLPNMSIAGAVAKRRKRKDARLIDITEVRARSEVARSQSVELGSLLRKDEANQAQDRLRQKVRSRVNAEITAPFQLKDIVEEVTEKLTDVAANDASFKRWF